LLNFNFWMRGDASPPPPSRPSPPGRGIEVVSGSVLSVSGGVERVLGPGETISTPPGEAHTVGPAGGNAVEMIVEFRPPLGFRGLRRAHLRPGSCRLPQRQGTGQPVAHGLRKTARGRVLPATRSERAAASRAARAGLARPVDPWHAPLTTDHAAAALSRRDIRSGAQRFQPPLPRGDCDGARGANAESSAPLRCMEGAAEERGDREWRAAASCGSDSSGGRSAAPGAGVRSGWIWRSRGAR
jgi:hypothetical protein